MATERQELFQEAKELGIDFPQTIKNTELAALIAESNATPVDPEANETAPIIAQKDPADNDAAPKSEATPGAKAEKEKPSPVPGSRAYIIKAKKKAFKTRVVTITNKDPRDNNVTTTAFLSFENQHFSLAKQVPLDIPVELEQGLINVAKSVNMTLHKNEIKRGESTGNKVPVTVKKYTISYGE
jgi:hypothetical protein